MARGRTRLGVFLVGDRTRSAGVASWLCAIACFLPGSAGAYCRTTTCDPLNEADRCQPVDGCATRGERLFWPDACVTFAVQELGSTRRSVTAVEVDEAMRKGFAAWLGTECDAEGGIPSLGVVPLGSARCDQVEFNPPEDGRAGAPNANLVIFRDDAWPYANERFVIARTSLTFDPNTGAIFDADIEVNSFSNEFSTGEVDVTNDLQGVLTHEIGHFLGLDHSTAESATMRANYDLSNLGARTLSGDDRAGICSIYSPAAEATLECPSSTGPHHGFSQDCGSDEWADASCLSLAPTGTASTAGWLAGAALAALGIFRRRSRCRL
jgi:hypothetical protein